MRSLKLILAEAESAALHAVLAAEDAPPPFTSQLAVTEVKRALHARGEAELAADVARSAGGLEVPGQMILARPVTAETFNAAGDLLPGTTLRSLDAVHLATALTAGRALTAVVTYDTRMTATAVALDLAILAPVGETADDPLSTAERYPSPRRNDVE